MAPVDLLSDNIQTVSKTSLLSYRAYQQRSLRCDTEMLMNYNQLKQKPIILNELAVTQYIYCVHDFGMGHHIPNDAD